MVSLKYHYKGKPLIEEHPFFFCGWGVMGRCRGTMSAFKEQPPICPIGGRSGSAGEIVVNAFIPEGYAF
jgi:hypothetical protein